MCAAMRAGISASSTVKPQNQRRRQGAPRARPRRSTEAPSLPRHVCPLLGDSNPKSAIAAFMSFYDYTRDVRDSRRCSTPCSGTRLDPALAPLFGLIDVLVDGVNLTARIGDSHVLLVLGELGLAVAHLVERSHRAHDAGLAHRIRAVGARAGSRRRRRAAHGVSLGTEPRTWPSSSDGCHSPPCAARSWTRSAKLPQPAHRGRSRAWSLRRGPPLETSLLRGAATPRRAGRGDVRIALDRRAAASPPRLRVRQRLAAAAGAFGRPARARRPARAARARRVFGQRAAAHHVALWACTCSCSPRSCCCSPMTRSRPIAPGVGRSFAASSSARCGSACG